MGHVGKLGFSSKSELMFARTRCILDRCERKRGAFMRMQQQSRRRLLPVAMMAALFPAWSSAVQAQEPYEVFFPLLIDLPAWKANEPRGLTMKALRTTIAMREYQRGVARFNVSV